MYSVLIGRILRQIAIVPFSLKSLTVCIESWIMMLTSEIIDAQNPDEYK